MYHKYNHSSSLSCNHTSVFGSRWKMSHLQLGRGQSGSRSILIRYGQSSITDGWQSDNLREGSVNRRSVPHEILDTMSVRRTTQTRSSQAQSERLKEKKGSERRGPPKIGGEAVSPSGRMLGFIRMKATEFSVLASESFGPNFDTASLPILRCPASAYPADSCTDLDLQLWSLNPCCM